MTMPAGQNTARTPIGVWFLIGLLPCLPAAITIWVTFAPPAGTIGTGLSISDSVVFIHCLRMFQSDFFLPCASALTPDGPHNVAIYMAPLLAIYGPLGTVGHWLGIPETAWLHFINICGGVTFLYAAYRFMRQVLPHSANLAFLLYALGGGLGGITYLAARISGWYDTPGFDKVFFRFARHELVEGPRLAPSLVMPRLYYTLALACCLGGLTLFMQWRKTSSRATWIQFSLLLAVGALINVRLIPAIWLAGMCCLVGSRERSFSRIVRELVTLTLPLVFGGGIAALAYAANPAFVRGATDFVRANVAPSSFLSATLLFWIILPSSLYRASRALPRLGNTLFCTATGFLVAFTVLYAGYQAYYGTWFNWIDYSASVKISDWALIGGLAGALFGYVKWGANNEKSTVSTDSDTAWIALYFVALLTAALGAFGQGWYLRLVPERLMVMLGFPMALLTATGLQHMAQRHSKAAWMMGGLIVMCGVCSTGVAWTCFHGPLGFNPNGPFPEQHAELMFKPDVTLLEHIETGMTLAPPTEGPCMGDIVTLKPGAMAPFGYNTLQFSDRSIGEARGDMGAFFQADTSPEKRKELAEKWGARYVLCPDTHPVAPETMAAFRATPWLRETAQAGKGAVFEVTIQP